MSYCTKPKPPSDPFSYTHTHTHVDASTFQIVYVVFSITRCRFISQAIAYSAFQNGNWLKKRGKYSATSAYLYQVFIISCTAAYLKSHKDQVTARVDALDRAPTMTEHEALKVI